MGIREKVTRSAAFVGQLICISLVIAFVCCEIFKYGRRPSLVLIGRIQFSIGIALTYFAYCIFCFRTETRSFLANSLSCGSVYEYVQQLQHCAPDITHNVTCYHFFYLSVFLMLGVAYCFYVDYLCYTQEFSIEKRVSVLPQVQVHATFSPVIISEAAPLEYDQQESTQLGGQQYQQPYYQSQLPTYQNYGSQQTNAGYSGL